MAALRFLIVEGNTRPARERHAEAYGLTPAASYAAVLQEIEPGILCDIALPADAGANLPDAAGLESYDGVVLTGSALNIYDATPEIRRQVELMRAVFASRTPAFGSCWGIQVGAVAAGGDVRRNPRGREVGFARNIAPTDAGRIHPMLAGRPPAYDAPTTHLDVVAVPPADCTVLAGNRMAAIQAAEIRVGGAALWACSTIPSSRSPRSGRSSTAAGSCCRRGLLPDARGRVGLCRRAQDAPRRPGAPRPRLATWARRRGARPGPAHRRNPQLHRAPGEAGEKPAREAIRPSAQGGKRALRRGRNASPGRRE